MYFVASHDLFLFVFLYIFVCVSFLFVFCVSADEPMSSSCFLLHVFNATHSCIQTSRIPQTIFSMNH